MIINKVFLSIVLLFGGWMTISYTMHKNYLDDMQERSARIEMLNNDVEERAKKIRVEINTIKKEVNDVGEFG